jgi:hypothetical protein
VYYRPAGSCGFDACSSWRRNPDGFGGSVVRSSESEMPVVKDSRSRSGSGFTGTRDDYMCDHSLARRYSGRDSELVELQNSSSLS